MYKKLAQSIALELNITLPPNLRINVYPECGYKNTGGMFCPPCKYSGGYTPPTIAIYGGQDFDIYWPLTLRHEIYHLYQFLHGLPYNEINAELFSHLGWIIE